MTRYTGWVKIVMDSADRCYPDWPFTIIEVSDKINISDFLFVEDIKDFEVVEVLSED